jgi:hypothetical protein
LTNQKKTSHGEALTTHFTKDGPQIRKHVRRFNPEITKKQKKLSTPFANPSGALSARFSLAASKSAKLAQSATHKIQRGKKDCLQFDYTRNRLRV